jgi:HPt (histidine-containing phosphotransfer) domain-containing protein
MDKNIHENSLDEAACPAWLEGDKKLLKGITAIFLKNVPAQMERLRDALEGNDARQVEILSHSLRGSAAMIGAHPLRDAALKVECAVIEGNLEKARSLYFDMDSELKNVLAALKKYNIGV